MPKLLTKKGQDATDENYFIGGTVERLRNTWGKAQTYAYRAILDKALLAI